MVTHQMASTISCLTNKIKYYRALSKYLSSIDCTIATEVSLKIVRFLRSFTQTNYLNALKNQSKIKNTIKKYDFETSDLVGKCLEIPIAREIGLQRGIWGEPQLLEF